MKSRIANTAKPAWLAATVLAVLALLSGAGAAHATGGFPVVTRASVDFTAGADGEITIVGQFLPTPPVVRLGGTVLSPVVSASPTQIVASLHNVAAIQDVPGDYLLVISKGAIPYAIFVATVGAVGPAGPTGALGPKGDMGDTGPQGLPGLPGTAGQNGGPGPAGPSGPAGLKARGAWDAGTNNYVRNDVVTQGGETWRCAVAGCTPGNEPSGTNAEWELLAAKGADGATGATGAQGPAGTNGANGTNGTNGTNGLNGAPGPPGTGTATHAAPPCFDNANRYVNCGNGGVALPVGEVGNGTVTDTVTGLIWLKTASCFGVLTYSDANLAATRLVADGQCGLTDGSSAGDWRLPTRAEWEATIATGVGLGCGFPSLTNDPGTACMSGGPTSFRDVLRGKYWSSSASEDDPTAAWHVNLFGGFLDLHVKARLFDVTMWAVRGGQ